MLCRKFELIPIEIGFLRILKVTQKDQHIYTIYALVLMISMMLAVCLFLVIFTAH